MKMNKVKKALVLLVTAALIVGIIKKNTELLKALETFSGIRDIVSGGQDFVILEIVDGVSEASVGYLVSGQEPNENGTGLSGLNSLDPDACEAYLAELRSRGLLAPNDNDDQSAYPIEHIVTESRYYDRPITAAEAGEDFEGYRERKLTVSGYYVPVTEPNESEAYYYRLDEEVNIGTMSQEELSAAAENLLNSFREEGYSSAELNGGQFFIFTTEEPVLDVSGNSTEPDVPGISIQSDVSGGSIESDTSGISIQSDVSGPVAGYVEGLGRQYEYIKDELVNHDWFKYYVLGLEENQGEGPAIKVTTYRPDGQHLMGDSFGSLTDAINRADLVVLNADGRYLGEDIGDISADAAKILLSRACAEKEDRLPVAVDSSASSAEQDNLRKTAVFLQQPDIGRAYEDFMEDENGNESGKFESAYDEADWELLRNSKEVLNGGNFVRENIYFVSYQCSFFNETTYGDTDVSAAGVFPLANADFKNQFSDVSVERGFAEVYRAILNENYTRGQNGQMLMDEYVTPAVAVAYIVNYQKYDPVIYKDQIRVLELEPCMDFTYYYPGPTNTDAGSKKQQEGVSKFIKDWAPSFAEKYEQNKDAVLIDGMTTAEFCGKIADVYEDYDLIYFGSNTGLFNRNADRFEWQEKDSCPETMTITNAKGRYWLGYDLEKDGNDALWPSGESRNTVLCSYRDGKWYVSFWTDPRHFYYPEWLEIAKEEVGEYVVLHTDLIGVTGSEDAGWTRARINGELANMPWDWRWTGSGWEVKTPDFWSDGTWGYDWMPAEPSDEGTTEKILLGLEKKPDAFYRYKDGKWYRKSQETDDPVWIENMPVEEPAEGTWIYSGGSEDNSEWKWEKGWNETSGRWYHKVTYNCLTRYNDTDMNGMVYTHVGDLFISGEGIGYGGLLNTETVDSRTVSRYSGNDILEWQVDELLNFMKSGSPIIVSKDFMAYDDDGSLNGINSSDRTYTAKGEVFHGILDTSSYVYQFMQKAYDSGYLGKGLLLEGTHNSEDNAVALNQQKLKLYITDRPTPYSYTETQNELGAIVQCTYLQPEADGKYYLNYEFAINDLNAVNPMAVNYDVKLFVDSNNDGIYNTETEELKDITIIDAQTGAVQGPVWGPMEDGGASALHYSLSARTSYRVRRELPQGYVGAIGWKLTATQVGNTGIHDSVVGLTAVKKQRINGNKVDPVTGKQRIRVLQITRNYNVTLNLERCMEYPQTDNDYKWQTLLNSIPDFAVNFDAISVNDFANSFETYGEEQEGKLTGQVREEPYLNFYDYDMVIVGFGDSYENLPSEKATAALLAYGNSGKSLMYTHDTTYSHHVLGVTDDDYIPTDDWSDDQRWFIGSHTSTLSMSIRNQCGMDRFGVSVNRFFSNGNDNPIRRGADLNEVLQFNTAANARKDSDIAYKPGSGQSVMAAETHGFTYFGMNAGLEGYANFNYSAINGSFPYSYSGIRALWMKEVGEDNHNRVRRVNSGIITQYPYNVGGGEEEIVVSNTHAQYFQVDLDTDWDGDNRGDIVVWYCISSLDDSPAWNPETGEFAPNDIYDYSPNDVRNNYYIYNRGNITYTGVGHDSNFTVDEMKLFINTFIAAFQADLSDPSIRIVDGPSVNAPDLESIGVPPFMAEDDKKLGVYYQVEDYNITTGNIGLSVTYYRSPPSESADGGIPSGAVVMEGLQTYAVPIATEDREDKTKYEPAAQDQIQSGRTYYVEVPLDLLKNNNENFDLYVKVDLYLNGNSISGAADNDRLMITKLKLFNLD